MVIKIYSEDYVPISEWEIKDITGAVYIHLKHVASVEQISFLYGM